MVVTALPSPATGKAVLAKRKHTNWNDNDDEQNNDSNDKAHSHLHVLPPHLLTNTVGTTSEALSGNGKVVCLILKRIQTLTTLGDFVDVLAHYTNGIVDLLKITR
jgi:hypothetical protein